MKQKGLFAGKSAKKTTGRKKAGKKKATPAQLAALKKGREKLAKKRAKGS